MRFVRGPKDFWSGVLFIAIGATTVLVALDYRMGTAGQMGPGYFPRALGTLLMMLGAISLLRGLRVRGAPIGHWRMQPLIIILGSVVVFGLILPSAGLVLSTLFLVLASSTASAEARPKEAAGVAVLMAMVCTGVFAYLLRIQVPVWPEFL